MNRTQCVRPLPLPPSLPPPLPLHRDLPELFVGPALLSVSCSSCHGSLCPPSLARVSARSPSAKLPSASAPPSFSTLLPWLHFVTLLSSNPMLLCQPTSPLILSFEVEIFGKVKKDHHRFLSLSFMNVVADRSLLDFLPFFLPSKLHRHFPIFPFSLYRPNGIRRIPCVAACVLPSSALPMASKLSKLPS